MSQLRLVPRPLALLLAVVLVFTSAWALLTPAWQAPDETVHFSYVQTIAELGRLPGEEGRPPVSTELKEAIQRTNVEPTIFFTYAKPEFSAAKDREWDRLQSGFPRDDGGGPNQTSTYPPLYYAAETPAYLLGSGGDAFTRLSLMRMWSGLWLLVGTVGAWLLAGELFARRRLPQLVAAAAMGLWPTLGFMSAAINPDAQVTGLTSVMLWWGVRLLRRGIDVRGAAILGGLAAAIALTKVSGLALVPPVLLLLAYAAWRARAAGRGRAAACLAAGVVALALPIGAWSLATRASGRAAFNQAAEVSGNNRGFNAREFASYLWQFYLPPLASMTPVHHHVPVVSERPVLNTWIGMSWGTFGWANVWFPRRVYSLFFAITALVAALALIGAVQRIRRRSPASRAQLEAGAFLGVAALTLVAALHWTDYGFYAAGKGLFAQGRYLFPVAAVGAVLVALAVESLPRSWRRPGAGAVLAGLLVLQVSSLGLIVTRWYA